MLIVSLLAIGSALALSALIALRYGGGASRPASLKWSLLILLLAGLLALFAFYVLFEAGVTGIISCGSARCGGSDADLSATPIRFWILYTLHWVIGFVCSLVMALGLASILGGIRGTR